jgi:hypothetical protein
MFDRGFLTRKTDEIPRSMVLISATTFYALIRSPEANQALVCSARSPNGRK